MALAPLDYRSPAARRREAEKSPLAAGVGVLILLATAALSSLLLAKILGDSPCNHWGFDVRYFWPLPLLTFLWGGLAWGRRAAATRLVVTVCLAAALLAVFLFLLDHFNLLVDYDSWLRRGMPDRWEWNA